MTSPPAHRHGWRKSSYSSANGACVEVALFQDVIAVRDSKDPDGPACWQPRPSGSSSRPRMGRPSERGNSGQLGTGQEERASA
ncbi:MAG: DUF397 domain-containing protein [Gemmatimonadales bacterium]